jgi:hypothetical protein
MSRSLPTAATDDDDADNDGPHEIIRYPDLGPPPYAFVPAPAPAPTVVYHKLPDLTPSPEKEKSSTAMDRVNDTAAFEELQRAFAAANPGNDIETVGGRDITTEDMLLLLGPSKSSLLQTIVVTLGNRRALEREREDGRRDKEALNLRGDDLIEELLKRERTLDDLLRTLRVTAGHLHRVGISSIEQLERLGFKAAVHLAKRFQAALPLYFMARYFDLNYARHLSKLTNDEFLALEPKKQDLLVLGVNADHLLKERQFTVAELQRLHIRPSSLVLYIDLKPAHLLSEKLALHTDDFRESSLWNKDRHESELTRAIYEQLRERERAQRNKDERDPRRRHEHLHYSK